MKSARPWSLSRLTSLWAVLASLTPAIAQDCIDFESLKVGTSYTVGSTFSDSGMGLSVERFQRADNTWTEGGQVQVDNNNRAGHTGLDLNLNNASLRFHFNICVDHLTLLFGEYGGNVNLEINHEFTNAADLADLGGTTLGGVQVTVLMLGRNQGRLILEGPIDRLALGGQELWIDHVCPDACAIPCVEFENPRAGTPYTVGDSFTDSGATISIEKFQWSTGTWTLDGYAKIDTHQLAGHVGQDLSLNNVNARFQFDRCVKGLTLLFGEYGGNVNLEVNGDFKNTADFAGLNGSTLGGVSVAVTTYGNSLGRLALTGFIRSFSLGGQELWIDHVCIDSCGVCVLHIDCPPDMSVVSAQAEGIVVEYPAPTVTGNCPPFTITCKPPSGNLFPLGNTVVTCTATDAASNVVSCQFTVTVSPLEIDTYTAAAMRLVLLFPDAGAKEVLLRGPMVAHVNIGPNGECSDTDGDGRDQAAARLVELTLSGASPFLGSVQVQLQDPATRPSRGEFEEAVNLTPGRLDLPPFSPLGSADSFFDVFFDIELGGALFRNPEPLRLSTAVNHKPPGPCEYYVSQQPVALVNAQGQSVMFEIQAVLLIPDPTGCLSLVCPKDIAIQCGTSVDPEHTGLAIASSNCWPDPTVTYSDHVAPGQCPVIQVITRTWTATDACGNQARCVQVITVSDTLPPMIQCPPDIIVGPDQSTAPAATGQATATDACDPSSLLTYSDSVVEGPYPVLKIITRTWTASDDCANSATCTQIIQVVDPASRCVDFESLKVGTVYSVGNTFADSGVKLSVEIFQWIDGTWTTHGNVAVHNNNSAGHTGLDLNLNNANLRFHDDSCIDRLTLRFGEYGGNVNLEVNGEFKNVAGLVDLDGTALGGVNVTVVMLNRTLGRLELEGQIDSFALGGQELWIDHVCSRICTKLLEITQIKRLQDQNILITFVYSGTAAMTFTLETSPAVGPGMTWTAALPPAVITSLGGGQYQALTAKPPSDSQAFFRIKGVTSP